MKSMVWSIALLVAAVLPVAVGAQSDTMAKGGKMDKMEAKDVTYTGCIAAGTAAGTFVLTHVVDNHVASDAMKKDAMKNDGMKKDDMAHDTMAATTMSVMSASVDLGKHVGHKVSVTGTAPHRKTDAMGKDAMAKDTMATGGPAFTVKSLKMIAASCS